MTTDISVGVRWDPLSQQEVIEDYDFEYDGGNSSSRLFERSRIRALAGRKDLFYFKMITEKFMSGNITVVYFRFLP